MTRRAALQTNKAQRYVKTMLTPHDDPKDFADALLHGALTEEEADYVRRELAKDPDGAAALSAARKRMEMLRSVPPAARGPGGSPWGGSSPSRCWRPC